MNLRAVPPLSSFPATGRCLQCDKRLDGRRKGTKYCSPRCRNRWYETHSYIFMKYAIVKRDKATCQLCGHAHKRLRWRHRKGSGFCRMEVDHVVPIADGGAVLDHANLRTLCTPCHKRVTAEWRRERAAKARAPEGDAAAVERAFVGAGGGLSPSASCRPCAR